MKRPGIEGEPIGTAAIDLFASGMGVFILMALLFMVFFANTARQTVVPAPSCPTPLPCPDTPSCPPPVQCPTPAPPCPQIAACPACPAIPELVCPDVACPDCPVCPKVPTPIARAPEPCPVCSDPEPVPACPEEPSTPLPELDLVIVLDSTGSMRFEIDALKRELHILADVLERMVPSLGIGVVTFNDRQETPVMREFKLRRLTGREDAMRDIQRFLRTIEAGDARGANPDVEEAVLTALTAAVNTSFRPSVTQRVIVVITDALAYDDEVPESLRLARRFASSPGYKISTVHVRDNNDSANYLTALAEAGGGVFVPDRGTILANVLLGIL